MTRTGSKLGWGRDGAPTAGDQGGDQDFGGQEERKGCLHEVEHCPAPSALLQGLGQPGAACSRALLARGSGFPQKLRITEPGNFKEETNPNCY